MIFCVMNGAERNRELIAYFEAKASRLRITNMMRMGWSAATDQAGLLGDKAQMLL